MKVHENTSNVNSDNVQNVPESESLGNNVPDIERGRKLLKSGRRNGLFSTLCLAGNWMEIRHFTFHAIQSQAGYISDVKQDPMA